MLTFQRPDFQRALLRQLGARCRTHPAKRLVSVVQPPSAAQPVQLVFADGSAATCDVLVGADGVASAVRADMLEAVADELLARGEADAAAEARRAVKPVWSGTMVYQTTIPAAALRARAADHRVLTSPHVVRLPTALSTAASPSADHLLQYMGKNAELTAYPIARGTLVSVAAFVAQPRCEGAECDVPMVVEARGSEVARGFVGWEPEVQALLGVRLRFVRYRISDY